MNSIKLTLPVNASFGHLIKQLPNAKFFWGLSLVLDAGDPGSEEYIRAVAYDVEDKSLLNDLTTIGDDDWHDQTILGDVIYGFNPSTIDLGPKKHTLILPEGVKVSDRLCVVFGVHATDSPKSVVVYFS